ncbi:NTPase KAP [Escherichia coli]|uniref:Qat anti-phage system ATPase QatA n=1 Tax=Enterobacteriaceae TaxID=543 RepID=UPI000EBA43F6|nr:MULTISPECIES: Qat anti-phage system ATPase QatA [Enterobacteriaceae]MCE0254334.1 KAP family NTPase [Klebsiella pneumoniae]HCB3236074.1 NTPase KAP [Citrobacter amalonaticus]HCK38379.1 NTPase KAP [Shigella sp.]EEV9242504.1 NTPase KAP [Escherichia coli]EFE8294216.1 NTPase KAP [Escherichia coli]
MLLTDNETKIDLLNNEAIATTIIGLLREEPNHPVTIGVHGDWGAGKSSVLEMIEAGFSDKNDVLCLKFNGWRFQGFEDAKIALIEGIVEGLLEKRPALKKAEGAIKDVFCSIDWLKVAKRAGGLALTAFAGVPTPGQIGAIVGSLEALLTDPTRLVTKENISTTIDEVKAVMKEGDARNVPMEVETFRKAFDQLLKDAGIKQLVVLVDDLDRCLPDTAIETLEAIRLFVFTARTAFVVAADEAMIEYSVRKHFPDLPDTTGPRDYARNYLEKLIQVPFRIPALGETETRIYVTLLLTGAEIGENNPDYERLITVAREKLKRPWTSGGLDAVTVKSILGQQADKANNALILSDQIGPILASGTKGNPRQIKRFLNTLLLRERTATARGFGDDIKLPVLAKLMLAERFIPRLFEQIALVAAVHSDGFCKDLEALETFLAITDGRNTKEKQATEVLLPPDSAVLTEWKSSEMISDWARLSPKLSGLDLRPYLFVTKDKKDYFGPVSVLGHLAEVVEKLFGGKMTVQSYESELKQLVQPEAEKVFEAVRSKIMSTATFDIKPSGVDGLTVLVKAQPDLQGQLMDFLEALPNEKCGPWAVSGWQSVIKDTECVARLTTLLGNWSKITTNISLKIAAEAALKSQKGIH